ncbi:MAG: YARHG domain-containing protein [Eggerthellaceae bacterium]|jgi:hypothetical protein
MKMRFCAKCGYPLPINVTSCIECGAPVEPDPEEGEAERAPEGESGDVAEAQPPHGAHAASSPADLPRGRETPIAWPMTSRTDADDEAAESPQGEQAVSVGETDAVQGGSEDSESVETVDSAADTKVAQSQEERASRPEDPTDKIPTAEDSAAAVAASVSDTTAEVPPIRESEQSDDAAQQEDRSGAEHTAAIPPIPLEEGRESGVHSASSQVRRISSSTRPEKQTRAQRRAALNAEHATAHRDTPRPAVVVAEKRSKKPLIIVIILIALVAALLVAFHPWAQEGSSNAGSSTTSAQVASSSSSAGSSSSNSKSSSKKASGSSSKKKGAKKHVDAGPAGTGEVISSENQGGMNSTGKSASAQSGSSAATGSGTASNGGNGTASSNGGNGSSAGSGAASQSKSTHKAARQSSSKGGASRTGGSYKLSVTTSAGVRVTGYVRRTASGYVISDSSTRYYTLKQLRKKGLSDAELCIAWNEPYARLGAHFANPDLQRYFESCSWYVDRGLTGVTLSGAAAHNVSLLHQIANEHSSSARWQSLVTG